ncbi:DUF305 domain-containing protein [Streptomyces sp. NPDC091272]|uniref:DUF305 domain-containing protein n=1 Tax=Streptomyces sp. NPDC091272 TaxID=3365981 RepID=UPI0037FBD710
MHFRQPGGALHKFVAQVPLAVAALLALSACSGTPQEDARAKPAGDTAVVAPGKPGEPARTLSPDEARAAAPVNAPNSADFAYTRMMTAHHGQALVMTALAPTRASSRGVRLLAERIAASQRPEIDVMAAWQQRNGADKRPEAPHDHGAMAGMATEKQLAELRAARGKQFDELFLKLMITHHKGALTMAGTALAEGNDLMVEEWATELVAQQTTEINRMVRMLKEQ